MSPEFGSSAEEPAGKADPGRAGHTRLVRDGALVLAAAALLTGCGSLKKSIDRIITTAPLPAPTVRLAATSPGSLFRASNLAPLVEKLTAQLSGHDIIVQLALYPGEL